MNIIIVLAYPFIGLSIPLPINALGGCIQASGGLSQASGEPKPGFGKLKPGLRGLEPGQEAQDRPQGDVHMGIVGTS